jgi:hypothetical protein
LTPSTRLASYERSANCPTGFPYAIYLDGLLIAWVANRSYAEYFVERLNGMTPHDLSRVTDQVYGRYFQHR